MSPDCPTGFEKTLIFHTCGGEGRNDTVLSQLNWTGDLK